MSRERGTTRGFERPWVALLGAGLVAAGCGTRLGDAEIRAGVFEAEPARTASASVDGSASFDATGGDGAGVPGAGPTGATREPSVGGTAPAADTTNVAGQPVSSSGKSGTRPAPPDRGVGTNPAKGGKGRPTDATPAGRATAASRITIGNIGDYSGVVGAVVGAGALGMHVAVRYINDHGGLDGHPVQLVVGDAAGDPARALSLVRDMVENKGVVAFAGNMWPLSGPGPKAYLEQKGIAVLGGEGTHSVWFSSPVYFPHGPSIAVASLAAAKTSVKEGKPKIAVLHCVEGDPCQVWAKTINAKAASVGAQVVYDAQVSLAQPDFTAECLQARRHGAEGIMAGVDGPSLARIARSCQQQGYRPLYVTLNLATSPATARDPNLVGLLTPAGQFPYVADDTPAAREYHAAIARYAPGAEEPATATAWAAGALLREVGKALPANPAPSDFLGGAWRIKENNLGGLTVPLTYVQGQPSTSSPCYFLMGVKDGRYVAPQGSKIDCL